MTIYDFQYPILDLTVLFVKSRARSLNRKLTIVNRKFLCCGGGIRPASAGRPAHFVGRMPDAGRTLVILLPKLPKDFLLRGRDSNPRPPGYGPGELPAALPRY